MTTERVTDLKPIHELLKVRDERDDPMDVTVSSDEYGSLVVSVKGGDSVTVTDYDHVNYFMVLHRMLAHYPRPVTLNGVEVAVQSYAIGPDIWRRRNQGPVISGRRDYSLVSPDDGVLTYGKCLIRVDGLTYAFECRNWPGGRNSLNACVAMPDPDYDAPHFAPVLEYNITPVLQWPPPEPADLPVNWDRVEFQVDPLAQNVVCVMPFAEYMKLAPQMMAQETMARRIIQEDSGVDADALDLRWGSADVRSRKDVHASRQYSGNGTPLLLRNDGQPVYIENQPRYIAESVAHALYETSVAGLVPVYKPPQVEPEAGHAQLICERVTIVDRAGATTVLDLRNEFWNKDDSYDYNVVRSIAATVSVTCGDGAPVEYEAPLNAFARPAGRVPRFWVTETALPTIQDDWLCRFIVNACYNFGKGDDTDFLNYERSVKILVSRLRNGEAAGFKKELTALVSEFEPQSRPPTVPTTIALAGRHALTWTPDGEPLPGGWLDDIIGEERPEYDAARRYRLARAIEAKLMGEMGPILREMASALAAP